MQHVKKLIILCMLIICSICLRPSSALAAKATTGWVRKENSYYYLVKGEKAKSQVKKISKKYYYFDKKGKRKTGWVTYKKNRYYFDKKTGAANTGVSRIGKSLYIFKTNGKLVQKKGLYTIDGRKYYVTKKGKLSVGWKTISDKKVYFDPTNGYMVTGLVTIGNKKYYFNDDGTPCTGMFTKNKQMFFCNGKGMLYTSQFVIRNGKTYYADAAGAAVKGFKVINSVKYYFGNDYVMKTGLVNIGSNLYFFNNYGRMMKNCFVTANGHRYYMDSNGCAKRNCWFNGYFFNNQGYVVENAVNYNENVTGEITTQMLDNLNLTGCSKLMIVAHPDDETFWGGAHLADGGYFVLCLTNRSLTHRAVEFQNVMRKTGNVGLILDYPDLINVEKFIRSDWKAESPKIVKDLNTVLTYKKWGLVVTHNPDGEYGHIHHKLTNQLVTQTYYRSNWSGNLYYFGKYYSKDYLEKNIEYIPRLPAEKEQTKRELLKNYPSQQNSLRLYSHMAQTEEWVRASDWK